MKSVARARRPIATLARNARRAPARQRGDAHERQADAAARGFVRGETRLHRLLTPAPAAGFVLAHSAGLPLPVRLRADLEHAFDADLRAVRLHSDAGAAAAAMSFGAHSFASGAHVYFGARQFRPDQSAGRELVAHEIAHVLQQTGRASAGRRFAVTPAVGAEGVQRKPSTSGSTPDEVEAQKGTFDAAVKIHTGNTGDSGDKDLDKTVENVRKLLDGRLASDGAKPAWAAKFNAAAKDGKFDGKSARTKSFVVELLKLLGFFEQAARICETDTDFRIRTYGFQQPFFEYLLHDKGFGRNRLARFLGHKAFEKFWPAAVLRGWREYFYRPRFVPGADAALETQFAIIKAHIEENRGKTPLKLKGEHYWATWKLIGELDTERQQQSAELRTQLLNLGGKQSLYETLVSEIPRLRSDEQKKLAKPETPEHERVIAKGKMAILDEVLPVWTQALAEYATWKREFSEFDLGTLLAPPAGTKFPDSGPIRPAAEPLRAPMVAAASALFETRIDAAGKLEPLRADEYKTRIDAFVQAMTAKPLVIKKGSEPLSYLGHLDAFVAREGTSAKPDPRSLAAFTLFPLIVEGVLALALGYDAALDQLSPSFSDMRLAHRARMARRLTFLGRWLQWDDLVTVVAPVLYDDEDPARIYDDPTATLWLISDWEPDDVRPVVGMLDDFRRQRDKAIIEDVPFTVSHIVQWFRYSYHKDLRARMEDVLRYEDYLHYNSPVDWESMQGAKQTKRQVKGAMAPTAEAEISIADTDVADFPLKIPQRFLVSDYEVLIPPGASVDWFAMQADHRKTKLQLERRAAYLLFPTDASQGVFSWLLPPLDDLLAVMKRIPRLVSLAKSYGIPDDRWMEGFTTPAKRSKATASDALIRNIVLSDADWAAFNKALERWIKVLGEHEEGKLPGLRRRVVILRRRWLMMNLARLVDRFAKYPYVSHGPVSESDEAMAQRLKTPEIVVNAVDAFERFARDVQLDTDDQGVRNQAAHAAEVQTALLIIGLSPSLLDLPLGAIDGYLKRHLYGFYSLAIEYASDAAKVDELKAGTGLPDEVTALVYSSDALKTMVERMKGVMRAIEKELQESQKQRGFSSDDGKTILPNAKIMGKKPIVASRKPDPQYEWRIGQTLGAEGKIDESSGVLYRLVDVYHKFEFHPRAGSPPVKGLRSGQGGPYSPAWIVVDGTRYDEPDLPDVDLLKIRIGESDHVVRANDLPLLDELDETFLWRSFSLGMEELAGTIETFEQWMMAVVGVFVPELAMAEFVANMTIMFANGEFNDLIEQLKDDPVELIKKTSEALAGNLFKPEEIWQFLLLGGQHSPWSGMSQFLPARKKKVNASPRTKFGRIAAALRALGARFHFLLERLRDYVRPPLRRVQGKVAMHPTLTWLLRRAAHLIRVLADLIPVDQLEEKLAKGDADQSSTFADILKGDTAAVDASFRERVVELFEGIQHVELPGELINLDAATEIIVSFILDRFGPRGKIIRLLLQAMPVPSDWTGKRSGGYTSAMSLITGEIAAVWRHSPLDPNNLWRKEIMGWIGGKFDSVRDDLVTGMYDLVDEVLGAMKLEKLTRPAASDMQKTQVIEEPLLPESEGSFGPAALPAAGTARISPAGGAPLPGMLRLKLEEALGADLSHVRLHPDAGAATASLGADALTSGSHIFVRPGISLSSTAGARLLAHESTHVVQQTGMLGQGTLGTRSPTLGRPALGVRFDPDRESIADMVSSQVAGGRMVSIALRQRIGHAAGVQPKLAEEVVESVFSTLTHASKPADFTKDLEGGRTPEGWTDARDIANKVFDKIKQVETIDFAAFMKDTTTGENVPKLVAGHVRELTDRFPEMELKRIAALAQKPRRKKADDDADTELNPKGFVQLLANYIYAQRHVALRIDTDKAVKKVEKVGMFYIDLAGIGGNARLWDLAMEASFKGNTHVTDLAKAQLELRQRLRALGPEPSVWDAKRFRFAAWLIDEYVDLLKARLMGKVADVPKVTEYTDPKSKKATGLAVSTHGDLTSRGIGAFDRESHHTTQYLLVEFFGNHPDASRRAFPPPFGDFKDAGIGFNSSGDGTVDEIRGSETLQIKPLNPNSGRGEGMPTILLSARCHQRGELHVLRESRWNDDPSHKKELHGTTTQGLAIENAFNKAIADPELRPRNADKEHRDRLKARIKDKPLSAAEVYYRAALSTYQWMRDRMIPALKSGLLTEEMAYYRGIAAQNHSEGTDKLHHDWDMEDKDLLRVFAAAEQNNDEVMAKYKWTAT